MSQGKNIRFSVRAKDGSPLNKERCNQLKGRSFKHADFFPEGPSQAAIIAVANEKQRSELIELLPSLGLEVVPGGNTTLPTSTSRPARASAPSSGRRGHSNAPSSRPPEPPPPPKRLPIRPHKPYAFLPVPQAPASAPPVWHDGSSSHGRYSGELRCELTNLTPLLVGWERKSLKDAKDAEDPNNLSSTFLAKENLTRLPDEKNLLCPLRLPGPDGRVLLPGESLKGLLRHELGALLGAPMERVKEQRYSYRPNLGIDTKRELFLVPRLAKVLAVESMRTFIGERQVTVHVPCLVQLIRPPSGKGAQVYLPRLATKDAKPHKHSSKAEVDTKVANRPVGRNEFRYRGGLGGGIKLPDETYPKEEDGTRSIKVYSKIWLRDPSEDGEEIPVPRDVQADYLRTVEHLLDPAHGHFSSRHPGFGSDHEARRQAIAIVEQANVEPAARPFQEGDMIWVEVESDQGGRPPKAITSFGSHYYYRWAYQDTIRTRGGKERAILSPTKAETTLVEEGELTDAPQELTAARRLFGYVNVERDSVCKGIGKGAFSQLAGRISINCAVEDTSSRSKETDRFLPPTYLKELGQPKPSAVEHYLQQPHIQATDAERYQSRGSDQAHLLTYGDLRGNDPGGELAGRKFYLDQQEPWIKGKQWEDATLDNQANERSTLAIDASKPGAVFRFTLRFRDLDATELSAVMLALCPNQLAAKAGGDAGKYCSKLGYARPLGWGSVQIQIKELHLLSGHTLDASHTAERWLTQHPLAIDAAHLKAWLALHQRHHNRAGDYPRERAKPKRGAPASPHPEGEIFTYHTNRRTEHTKLRRLRPPQGGTP